MKNVVYKWLKTNSVMFLNAGSLVGTTAVTSMLGFVYWWAAARLFPPETIGFASATISAMTLLASMSILGLGTLLIGEVKRHPGKEMSLISAALLLVGVVGGGAGILFTLIAPFISADFRPLSASLQNILLFAGGVCFSAITLVLDQALIGLLRGELQLWRNTLFAAIKLAALFGASLWLSHAVGLSIYNTWTLGNILSLGVLTAFVLSKRKWSGRKYLPHWGLLRELKAAALQHHILNLIIQAPALALPIFVTALLSTRANAWFYIAWMITSFLSVASQALSTVLYAETATQSDKLAQKTRLTISVAFVICVLANFVLQLGAKQVLGVFGHDYAEQALLPLRILSLAVFPSIIKNNFIAICRIQNRLVQTMLPLLACGILELSFVTIGVHFGGLAGLSLGYVIALFIEAICMFSAVYKIARFTHTSTSEDRQDRDIQNTQNADDAVGGKQCVS
ncbi:MAG: lipopolysaccharide biosynthesis protein [Ktedonobacteraceae bacterium]